MMRSNWFAMAVLGIGWGIALPAQAAIYSPTQAELNGLMYVDFIDNEEPDNAQITDQTLVGSDGVQFTYDTDFDENDSLYRVAVENEAFSLDLDAVGADAFNILFTDPVAPEGINLSAQMFVRSNDDMAFTGTNPVELVPGQSTLLSIPRSAIQDTPNGDITDISSFGIEFFGGDEFLGTTGFMTTARTAPQIQDERLFSWETPDDPITVDVDERFEGWTVGFDETPETMHSIYTDPDPGPGPPGAGDGKGATHGSHALQIERTFTEMTFRWGSQFELAAGEGPSTVGDYNSNGTVDAADYTVWRDNLGQTTQLDNEDPAASPGEVTSADYAAWKSNYGNTGGGADPVQARIDEIVDLLEDPNSFSIAFDVTVNPQLDPPPPTFLGFELSISDSDGEEGTPDHFFQAAAPALFQNQVADISEESTYTIEFLLENFIDVAQMSPDMGESLVDVGLYEDTPYLRIGLSSNLDSSFTYQIDNFRIRQTVDEGSGSLAAGTVPEPAAPVLALFACGGWCGRLRRRLKAASRTAAYAPR